MSNAEIAKDIVVAMINSKSYDTVNSSYTESIIRTYENIYNKVKELNK